MAPYLLICFSLSFFSEATQDYVQVIKNCLDAFCAASRQKVSLSKSQMFFFLKNVDSKEAKRITTKAGIKQTTDLGRYLGVPSIHGRTTIYSLL